VIRLRVLVLRQVSMGAGAGFRAGRRKKRPTRGGGAGRRMTWPRWSPRPRVKRGRAWERGVRKLKTGVRRVASSGIGSGICISHGMLAWTGGITSGEIAVGWVNIYVYV
jgi:hypothetical protein